MGAVIIGTGSYLPERKIPNTNFFEHRFFEKNGEEILRSTQEIISKFRDITEIEERRYVNDNQVASDIGFIAATRALEDSGIDPETLDYLIVAHNFGDIPTGGTTPDVLPALASRIKHQLKIQNPECVAYDLPFGCPGWVQGLIQADYFLRSGDARRALVIGAEVLSRVTDPHDRDTMIFADGAAAAVLEYQAGPKE